MGIFKAGVAIAAGACAWALIAGHGHPGLGFDRIARDAQATWNTLAPQAQSAGRQGLHAVGKALVASQKTTQESYAQISRSAPQAAESIMASAKAGALDAWAKAQQARPVDHLMALSAIKTASATQKGLDQALMGLTGIDIPPPPSLTARLADTPADELLGQAQAERLALMGKFLLAQSPTLRELAIPQAALRGDAPSRRHQSAQAANAFSKAFAEALAAGTHPDQAVLWGIPSDQDMAKKGFIIQEQARSHHRIRIGDDPIDQALESALRASRHQLAAKAKHEARPDSNDSMDFSKPIQTMDARSMSMDAASLGGQARVFTARKLGLPPPELAALRDKIIHRRAMHSEPVAKPDASPTGSAL